MKNTIEKIRKNINLYLTSMKPLMIHSFIHSFIALMAMTMTYDLYNLFSSRESVTRWVFILQSRVFKMMYTSSHYDRNSNARAYVRMISTIVENLPKNKPQILPALNNNYACRISTYTYTDICAFMTLLFILTMKCYQFFVLTVLVPVVRYYGRGDL